LNSFGSTLDDALANETVEQTGCGATDDHGAAVTAFLDRQTPVFTGR
jgi:2-(1,2-epoxy-1,2-dihydrophenyl)acetyl-CoA isomerase